MGIKEYIEEKAKRTALLGLTAATILGGAMGLTSCDNNENPVDASYAGGKYVKYLDEEFFGVSVSYQEDINKYMMEVITDPNMFNKLIYTLTKDQFDFIMESSRDFADGKNIMYSEGVFVSFTNKDALNLEGLESVKNAMNDIVKTQKPKKKKPTTITERVVESGDDYVIYEMK